MGQQNLSRRLAGVFPFPKLGPVSKRVSIFDQTEFVTNRKTEILDLTAVCQDGAFAVYPPPSQQQRAFADVV